ncbi:MAG: class F sortase [Thermomicrobiales bacterium]
MKGAPRQTGPARVLGFLVVLALLIGLLLPLVAVGAQDDDDVPTTEALAEVPSTGGRRPGPVILSSSRIPVPEPEVVAGVAPIALQVDKFGIDAPIELGAVVDGIMQDPSGPWVVSWYDGLGKIGEGGNVIVAGHVDYYTVGPAVFWDVGKLVPGDVIRLIGEDGQSYEYAVEWLEYYDAASLTPEIIQTDIVGDTGQESLTIITCGGVFDPATAQYNERWVLRANLI